jgi:UDP-galactopyranose mutase
MDHVETKIPYYPWPKVDQTYRDYQSLVIREKDTFFAGRLGTYKYLNMDQAVLGAIQLAEKISCEGNW